MNYAISIFVMIGYFLENNFIYAFNLYLYLIDNFIFIHT